MENLSRLDKIIANLKLKELEIIEKISDNIKHDSKMLRMLISPNQHNFIAVNGDWNEVLGYEEEECRGKCWNMIIPDYELKRTSDLINKTKEIKEGFSDYVCDVITKTGLVVKTSWRVKYCPDLNMVISIGRVVG